MIYGKRQSGFGFDKIKNHKFRKAEEFQLKQRLNDKELKAGGKFYKNILQPKANLCIFIISNITKQKNLKVNKEENLLLSNMY